MVLRALLFMAVAAIVLAPREPKPAPPGLMPAAAVAWVAKTVKNVPPCSEREPCLRSVAVVAELRDTVIARLARAGQEIRASDPRALPRY